MKETPIKAKEPMKLSMKAYDMLKGKIVSGELPAGATVTQRDIAAQLGVSRTPVRDAMLQLEQEGLLKSIGNGLLMVIEVPVEDMKRTYELRALLEGFAAKEVAKRKNPKTIAMLKEIIEDQKRLVRSNKSMAELGGDFVKLDSKFHKLIFLDTENPRLIQIMKYLMTLSECQSVRSRGLEVPGRMEKSIIEHESILRAIETGIPEAANAFMAANLEGFCNDVVSHILNR